MIVPFVWREPRFEDPQYPKTRATACRSCRLHGLLSVAQRCDTFVGQRRRSLDDRQDRLDPHGYVAGENPRFVDQVADWRGEHRVLERDLPFLLEHNRI